MNNGADGQPDAFLKRDEALLNMQKLYLEALRSRENEVLQFIVIIASALGGFSWLLGGLVSGQPHFSADALQLFIFGVLAILLLLSLGAMYTLALGYNYRSMLLQIRKLEEALKVNEVVLCSWSTAKCEYSLPEILKHFYTAYLLGHLLVALSTAYIFRLHKLPVLAYFSLIMEVLVLSYLYVFLPNEYGIKIGKICTEGDFPEKGRHTK